MGEGGGWGSWTGDISIPKILATPLLVFSIKKVKFGIQTLMVTIGLNLLKKGWYTPFKKISGRTLQ